MTDKMVPKSPVFPQDKRWDEKTSSKYYESEVTAMMRSMLKDPVIEEDQKYAWQRWRSGQGSTGKD